MKLKLPNGFTIIIDSDVYQELLEAKHIGVAKDNKTHRVIVRVDESGHLIKKHPSICRCGKSAEIRGRCWNHYCNDSYHLRKLGKKWPTPPKSKLVPLSRYILKPPRGLMVDHSNRNGLDNRRCNLRICSNQLNQYNTSLKRNNTTGYKGVSFQRDIGKYTSKIGVNNKVIYLGSYDDPKVAYEAYKKAATQIAGEYAFI